MLIRKIELDPGTKRALQELLSRQYLSDEEVAQLRKIADAIVQDDYVSPYRSVPCSSGESRSTPPARSSG